jgi:hypothetical protein
MRRWIAQTGSSYVALAAARRHHRQRRVPGLVPTTAEASTSGAMRWLMAHVLPHMPSATRADAAADSFLFMALDRHWTGLAGSSARSTRSSRVPSHTTLTRPGASGSWRASSLAWTRPERNAFWVSVYWLRTATRPEEPRLGSALNALTMYYRDRMTVG